MFLNVFRDVLVLKLMKNILGFDFFSLKLIRIFKPTVLYIFLRNITILIE